MTGPSANGPLWSFIANDSRRVDEFGRDTNARGRVSRGTGHSEPFIRCGGGAPAFPLAFDKPSGMLWSSPQRSTAGRFQAISQTPPRNASSRTSAPADAISHRRNTGHASCRPGRPSQPRRHRSLGSRRAKPVPPRIEAALAPAPQLISLWLPPVLQSASWPGAALPTSTQLSERRC